MPESISKQNPPEKVALTPELIRQLVSNKEASQYIGCAANSLKQSRVTGQLFGVQAPAFLKMGYNIRYKLTTLDKWLSQFTEKQNTAQTNAQ